MGQRDPRIDAYIKKSAEFARPIMTELRARVHASCPDVVETLKWSHPSFEYKGILCGMASFKQHAAFGFWKHKLVVGDDKQAEEAMGSFGCLKQLSDLPPKARFAGLVKKAMQLNDEGVKVVRDKTKKKKSIPMHPEFAAALSKSKKARATFDGFPPSGQREYLEWIDEAKRDETRARRIETALDWLAQGKARHWKYEKC